MPVVQPLIRLKFLERFFNNCFLGQIKINNCKSFEQMSTTWFPAARASAPRRPIFRFRQQLPKQKLLAKRLSAINMFDCWQVAQKDVYLKINIYVKLDGNRWLPASCDPFSPTPAAPNSEQICNSFKRATKPLQAVCSALFNSRRLYSILRSLWQM